MHHDEIFRFETEPGFPDRNAPLKSVFNFSCSGRKRQNKFYYGAISKTTGQAISLFLWLKTRTTASTILTASRPYFFISCSGVPLSPKVSLTATYSIGAG